MHCGVTNVQKKYDFITAQRMYLGFGIQKVDVMAILNVLCPTLRCCISVGIFISVEYVTTYH